MDGLSLRRRGRAKAPALEEPLAQRGKEIFLQRPQLEALFSTYHSSSAIGAVREILLSQLFAGGICVKRNGEDVTLTPVFDAHLQRHWTQFGKDCVDSILTFGLVVWTVDESLELRRRQKRVRRRPGTPLPAAASLLPLVPPLDTVDISVAPAGRMGYQKEFRVYTRSPTR